MMNFDVSANTNAYILSYGVSTNDLTDIDVLNRNVANSDEEIYAVQTVQRPSSGMIFPRITLLRGR